QAVATGLVSDWFVPAPRLPSNAICWIVVSNLLTAGILALIALRSSQRGAGLAVRLAAVFFGVSTFNNMIEALFFHVVSAGEFVRYLLQGALTAFPFSFALVGLLGLRRAERPGPSRASDRFELPAGGRWAHLFEVGASNFGFGWIAAWLLSPPPARVAALAGSSA